MKIAMRRETTAGAEFEEAYVSLLRKYVSGGGETTLGKVYELGRQAIIQQKSLVEIASLHHQALQKLIAQEKDDKRREELVRESAAFLAEFLSSYEMAHRGFQDAVTALRRLNETLEEEIKRIAYAVHDEAGQLLVAVHLALAELTRELPKPKQQQVGRIEELLKEVEKHLRRYSHELRPTILDDLGWIPAIRFLAEGVSKRASLPIHIETTLSERFSGTTETALYRIVQEALTNAVKHAKASNVWIRAWEEKQMLCCSIRDDGAGFDSHLVQTRGGRKGLGLVAMQERLSAIGGTLQIDSIAGRGTEISIRLPLEDDHANSSGTRR